MVRIKKEEQIKAVESIFNKPVQPKRSKKKEPKVKVSPEIKRKKATDKAEEKPKYLTTKQSQKGILHCEIGPELYERAALFAYATQSPVRDLTDLARTALDEYLNKHEEKLEKIKKYQENLDKD